MRHKGLVAVSLCMLGLAGCHNIRTARDPQDQVLRARNLLHGSGSSSENGRLIFANALGFNITILSVQFRPDDVFSVTRRGWGSGRLYRWETAVTCHHKHQVFQPSRRGFLQYAASACFTKPNAYKAKYSILSLKVYETWYVREINGICFVKDMSEHG